MRTFRIQLFILSVLLLSDVTSAQMWRFKPDSLQSVTVTGKIIKDSTISPMSMYYLDTDSNGTPDFMLNLGPIWYMPDSSSAQRPVNGQQVTIKGGQTSQTMMNNLKMIVVYEINGAFWRDPFDATWNNMGFYSHMGGHMMNGCRGYGFGFMHDSLKSVTLSGRVYSDTTLMYELTYLDVNKDQKPDYFLNLGPYWYQPASGAKRPAGGDSVIITGGLLQRSPMKMVIVYTINGQLWRDSSTVNRNLGGGWMTKNMSQSVKFHSPFDTTTWMMMNPNWNSGMMGGGMMMPDSLYAQILELIPGSIPNKGSEKIVAGYEISFFSNSGTNPMMGSGNCGGHMNFNSPVKMQMHFTDLQLKAGSFNKNTVKAKFWDNTSNTWITVNSPVLNSSNNTITFSQNSASTYVILTADQNATGVKEENGPLPDKYTLDQNYPNPFNPSTLISYQIIKAGKVTLKVYDMLGKEVAGLIDENQNPGSYSVRFNAGNLPSGIYLYELTTNSGILSRKMVLLK
ncbi:MAG: T9SS type A sorting domain-containing protein [Syntrophothermus sp.]